MNEDLLKKLLSEKIITYNDLNDQEFRIFQESLIRRKPFPTDSRDMYLLFKQLEKSYERDWSRKVVGAEFGLKETRFRFSNEPLFIPTFLNTIMEYLVSRDLEVEGIFKKSPNQERIIMAVARYRHCFENNEDIDQNMKEFSTLEIASVFKEVLGCLGNPILPSGLVPYLCLIQKADLTESERIRAIKVLIMQIPKDNLDVFQSTIAFIKIIHHIVSQYKSKNMQQISLKGFAAVITPRLIPTNKIKEIQDLVYLSDIMMFITENIEKIISIYEIY
ncbi:Rho GTPase-activating protein [Pseudoloma neurophilia]|uniref:Rho GTPase-activating protein n=1 Tax=Pseudoloma neurophilia TaxID=146866 RepID=A0A0R0LZC3_9MICR|nr:Rho GTPase-activating protein [Pseudoloma neurophilia]